MNGCEFEHGILPPLGAFAGVALAFGCTYLLTLVTGNDTVAAMLGLCLTIGFLQLGFWLGMALRDRLVGKKP